MGDKATLKEGSGAASLGEVEQPIRDDDIPGCQVLFQGPTGADSYDTFYTQGFEGVDIGPVIDLTGRDGMSGAVTGQKGYWLAI